MTKILDYLLQRDTSKRGGLLPLEWLVLGYTALTSVFIVLLYGRMNHPGEMLLSRAGIVLLIGALWRVYRLWPTRLMLFVRVAAHLALLAYWYPDTYEFNRLFPNLDHIFATADQNLFGFQPAVRFSQTFTSPFWSEAFNLGYWAYYPMIAAVTLFYFFCRYPKFQRITFIIICSFFLYYLIYMFVPVAGPQFYFLAIGADNVQAANFPAVADYFNTHTAMLPAPGYTDGFFYHLVTAAQDSGERPTAAFPSSHIGMSTILLILSWRGNRKLFCCLLPFYILLCCATVYIQAHYFVDGVAGVLSAFVAYGVSCAAWTKVFGKREERG